MKKALSEEHYRKMKDIEEENLILMEGLKSEYEERLQDVKLQILQI